jgi:hypothetical protein
MKKVSVAPENWAIMAPKWGHPKRLIINLLGVAQGQLLPLRNEGLSGIYLFTRLLFTVEQLKNYIIIISIFQCNILYYIAGKSGAP